MKRMLFGLEILSLTALPIIAMTSCESGYINKQKEEDKDLRFLEIRSLSGNTEQINVDHIMRWFKGYDTIYIYLSSGWQLNFHSDNYDLDILEKDLRLLKYK